MPAGVPLQGWTMWLHVRHNDREEASANNYHWWIGREHKTVFENAIIETVCQALRAKNQSEFDNFLDKHRLIADQMKTDWDFGNRHGNWGRQNRQPQSKKSMPTTKSTLLSLTRRRWLQSFNQRKWITKTVNLRPLNDGGIVASTATYPLLLQGCLLLFLKDEPTPWVLWGLFGLMFGLMGVALFYPIRIYDLLKTQRKKTALWYKPKKYKCCAQRLQELYCGLFALG